MSIDKISFVKVLCTTST